MPSCAALTAVGFRERNTHQTLFGHQLGDIKRMLDLMRALERAGFQVFLRKAADGVAELLLLGGEVEVHEMVAARGRTARSAIVTTRAALRKRRYRCRAWSQTHIRYNDHTPAHRVTRITARAVRERVAQITLWR